MEQLTELREVREKGRREGGRKGGREKGRSEGGRERYDVETYYILYPPSKGMSLLALASVV